MIEYDFTLHTKYSFFLYAQNKNYPIKLLKPKSFLSSKLKKKKKKILPVGVWAAWWWWETCMMEVEAS